MTKTKKSLLLMLSIGVSLAGAVLTLGNGKADAHAAEAPPETVSLSATVEVDCAHEYTERIVPATCTEQGYTEYECVLCGDSKRDNYTDAKGHDYMVKAIAATCTTKGYLVYTCQTCRHRIIRVIFRSNRT